ncbi:hypothetical protein EDB84DRAFT_661590 [Lactarius hengduanensis]|nr:hypothetical protein EDB84DRAFT_661590 [Lactarius hengduanensis]
MKVRCLSEHIMPIIHFSSQPCIPCLHRCRSLLHDDEIGDSPSILQLESSQDTPNKPYFRNGAEQEYAPLCSSLIAPSMFTPRLQFTEERAECAFFLCLNVVLGSSSGPFSSLLRPSLSNVDDAQSEIFLRSSPLMLFKPFPENHVDARRLERSGSTCKYCHTLHWLTERRVRSPVLNGSYYYGKSGHLDFDDRGPPTYKIPRGHFSSDRTLLSVDSPAPFYSQLYIYDSLGRKTFFQGLNFFFGS